MKTLIAWSIIVVLVMGVLFYNSFQETKEDIECRKKHGGKLYVETNNYAYTPQGCRVVQIVSYNQDCLPYYTVYVTECKGIDVVTDPYKKERIILKEVKQNNQKEG